MYTASSGAWSRIVAENILKTVIKTILTKVVFIGVEGYVLHIFPLVSVVSLGQRLYIINCQLSPLLMRESSAEEQHLDS